MSAPRSDGLVLFGASGDLAHKKIFPALQALTQRGHLDVPVVGVARSEWSLEEFRAHVKEGIQRHGRFDEAVFAKLGERLFIDRRLRLDDAQACRRRFGRKRLAADPAAHRTRQLRHGSGGVGMVPAGGGGQRVQ